MSSFEDYEQKEWLRVTLASIGDAVITTDTNGNVTFLNPVAQSLTGWTLEEAVGVPLDRVFEIINEETRRPVENPVARALREGKVVGLANHTLLIARDSTETPIDDSAAPIRNERGEIAGVVLVFRDVTERRHTERSLQSALDYCQNISAALHQPVLVLDSELRVRTANAAFCRQFRVSREDTEQRFIYDLGDRQWDISELRKLLEGVLQRNEDFKDYEIEHDFRGIGHRIIVINACKLLDEGRSSDLILLAINDVTEGRKAEARIQVSEIRYRRLFEAAKDGILILDADTAKIIDANPYIRELLGYSHSQLMGRELWQIGLLGDEKINRAAVRELQERGYIRYEHLPLETRDGRRAYVEIISNVYEEDHRRVIQCNIRDITERVRLEQQLQKQTEELADLHRRKDEFLAMLSHELRNPLAAILNAVHLLRLQKSDSQHLQPAGNVDQQARGIIERQVRHLSRLVEELLEISRLTTGRIQLHQEDLDLRGIVEQAAETLRPIMDQSAHTLSISLPSEPLWVRVDPVRMEQVMVNLLGNAAKYTRKGGHIWLTAQREGSDAVVRVRDTGVGIAPDLLPRIFDLFTQADRSLARSEGGLGIGLSLAQRLVDVHGGTIEAHSAGLEKGSEFVVRLPALRLPAEQSQSSPVEPSTQSVQIRRVLVVDDNADVADSIAMFLQLSGHNVRVVYSGQAALETAAEYRPDLVLLDIGLPDMDGYETARRLRQHTELRDVRLIAVTGYGQDSDRQLSLEAGFDEHLVKPIDLEKIQELLAMLTTQGRREE